MKVFNHLSNVIECVRRLSGLLMPSLRLKACSSRTGLLEYAESIHVFPFLNLKYVDNIERRSKRLLRNQNIIEVSYKAGVGKIVGDDRHVTYHFFSPVNTPVETASMEYRVQSLEINIYYITSPG